MVILIYVIWKKKPSIVKVMGTVLTIERKYKYTPEHIA